MAKKLAAVEPKHNPCLHCPDPTRELSLDRHIAVGFGDAHLECDGRVIWSENHKTQDNPITVKYAEKLAAKEPKKDWRIVLFGPLHGEVYQRQGNKKWVCVETNEGFA